MIKKDATTDKHAIRFAIAADHHVCVSFGYTIGVIGIDRGFLGRGVSLNVAENFAGGGLVDFGVWGILACGFKNSDRAEGGDFAGIDGMSPAVGRHRLGGDIVDFVRLVFAHNTFNTFGVDQIGCLKNDFAVEVFDIRMGNVSAAADGADDLIAFF